MANTIVSIRLSHRSNIMLMERACPAFAPPPHQNSVKRKEQETIETKTKQKKKLNREQNEGKCPSLNQVR
ncbi:Uncharacterized protein APZ42_032200 [Daphnia magna]|uniref:Uncharacterized protein n=1 Tax=Daphnia magna TaxID=35525 RepID=A0A164M8C8_9CRUS|nr:Uncharacterized protein APZ42_032200 [Daphnia magna]